MNTPIIVQELERRLFPQLNRMKEQIVQEFPDVKVNIWSHSIGLKTNHQGHGISIECFIPNVMQGQMDSVSLAIDFQHLTTLPELVSADVCWGNGYIEAELINEPIELDEAVYESLDEGLQGLFNDLRLAIERGFPLED
jgi:hypothetical protein